MKKVVAAALVMGALFSAQVATAGDFGVGGTYHKQGEFYLPISFGFYQPESASNLGRSPILDFGVGYNLTNIFSVQGMFSLFNPRDSQTDKSYTGVMGRAEFLAHVPTGTPFEPYAAAGIGINDIKTSYFMADFGLGAHYYLAPNMALSLDWRYIKVTSDNRNDYMLTGGIVYNFGGATELPPATSEEHLTKQQDQMMAEAKTELKPYLPDGVRLCQGDVHSDSSGCVTIDGNQMAMNLYVQFELAKSDIQSRYVGPIDRLAKFMKAYPDVDAQLRGYASSEGSLSFNRRLSNQRAQAVKEYLINDLGVKEDRLSAVGYGISNPIANNATESGRELNRRVQASVSVPLKTQQ